NGRDQDRRSNVSVVSSRSQQGFRNGPDREPLRAGSERRLASWGGAAARQASRWEGEGGPQRRGGDARFGRSQTYANLFAGEATLAPEPLRVAGQTQARS